MTPNLCAASLLFNTPQMYCAKLTAAGSGGRANKCGNGVKKQGAGRVFLPALMQEKARPSGTELWSEPRTTWRAPGREATVSGDLEILEVLFNSWLGEWL